MNSARYFIRREDDEPRRTPRESPFRRFEVKCLRCGTYRVRPEVGHDAETGTVCARLTCPRCRVSEDLPQL